MIKSLQNITFTIVLVSVLSLVSSLAITTLQCTSPSDCLATVSLYKMSYDQDFKIHQTTASTLDSNSGISFDSAIKAIQVVSTYALLTAVIVMIGLELFELRYFKIFILSKKRHATVSRR